MTDLTGGPIPDRDPVLREPRQRVAEMRAATGRTRRAAARDVAEEDSLLAAGIDTFNAKARELKSWSTRQTEVSRDTVKLHPFTSCAATFGAGVLFGILLTRR